MDDAQSMACTTADSSMSLRTAARPMPEEPSGDDNEFSGEHSRHAKIFMGGEDSKDTNNPTPRCFLLACLLYTLSWRRSKLRKCDCNDNQNRVVIVRLDLP